MGDENKRKSEKKKIFFCVHFKTEMHHLRTEEDEDEQRSQNKMRRKTFSMIKLASSYEL